MSAQTYSDVAVCSATDCSRSTYAKGVCRHHYDKARYQANADAIRKQKREQMRERYASDPERRKIIRARNDAWRERNRDRDRAWRKSRYQERLALLDAYKSEQGCLDCGQTEGLLHFDHRTDKAFAIGKYVMCRWDKVLNEIGKCEVRCPTCHAKRHNALRPRKNGRFAG